MKKVLAFLLVFAMALSLIACGGNGTDTGTESKQSSMPTEPDIDIAQVIADCVNAKLQSDTFSDWRVLYQDFTGKQPGNTAKITNIIRYQIDDFESVKVDCYLVNVAAEFAHWVNKDAEQGSIRENICFYIDANTKASYDSVSTSIGDMETDLSTELGRATYLVGIYDADQSGSFAYDMYVNDTEIITELTEAEIAAINNLLLPLEEVTAAAVESTQPISTESTEGNVEEIPQTDSTEATSEPFVSDVNPADEQQIIADAINGILLSDTYAAWQELYKTFAGSDPEQTKITRIVRYQIDNFDGEKMDCYLIDISADIAYWINEENMDGITLENFRIFIDRNSAAVYDSITTDTANFNGDTSTSDGKALYLLWMFGNMQDGFYEGDLVNSEEIITDLEAEEIASINEALAK